MTPLDAMKQALDALQSGLDHRTRFEVCGYLRTAIAELESAEPTRCKHDVWIADHCYQCEMERGRVKELKEMKFTHPAQSRGSALQRYTKCAGDEETDPLERLRFFCSLAMNGQDWLDVECFFDGVRDSIIEECAIELEKGISVGIEANTIFEYCAKKVRALKGK